MSVYASADEVVFPGPLPSGVGARAGRTCVLPPAGGDDDKAYSAPVMGQGGRFQSKARLPPSWQPGRII